MSREVWCIVEHRGGEVDNDSLQLFGAVHRLDGEAVAVVCGDEVAGLAEQISGECDRVISLSSSALASFTPDGMRRRLFLWLWSANLQRFSHCIHTSLVVI